MEALDAFDRRLLHAMQRSPRQTLTELAERVNLSPSQCSRRIARLEARGIIQGYALRLAPEALGLMVTAFITVSVEKARLGSPRETIAALLACDEVIDCHSTTGSHDFILNEGGGSRRTLTLSLVCGQSNSGNSRCFHPGGAGVLQGGRAAQGEKLKIVDRGRYSGSRRCRAGVLAERIGPGVPKRHEKIPADADPKVSIQAG